MTSGDGWHWRSPPNWPPAPPAWRPWVGWAPPADWPPAPPGWNFWVPAGAPPLPPAPTPVRAAAAAEPGDRRQLILETWFAMTAFLAGPLISAIVVLAQHLQGDTGITRFPTIVHDPVANMLLGILDYLPVAAVVPLGWFLLVRSGHPPSSLGVGRAGLARDLGPAVGIALAGYGGSLVLAIIAYPLVKHSKLLNSVPIGHVPSYYVVWGVSAAAITAVAEETFVNGYFLTRLQQLGWSPGRALALSLAVRTSYHVYYGIGFLFTIPFGFFATRSFQKRRRLNRAIAAHFLYDSVLFVITILTS